MVLYIQFYKTCTSILTIQLHLLKENFLTPKIIKSQNTQGKIKKTHKKKFLTDYNPIILDTKNNTFPTSRR